MQSDADRWRFDIPALLLGCSHGLLDLLAAQTANRESLEVLKLAETAAMKAVFGVSEGQQQSDRVRGDNEPTVGVEYMADKENTHTEPRTSMRVGVDVPPRCSIIHSPYVHHASSIKDSILYPT